MRISLYDKCIEDRNIDLLVEWDRERNEPLMPWDVSRGSHRVAWWKCSQGHEWQAAIYVRTGGHGCPFCKGKRVEIGHNDLASQHPELVEQWDTLKNMPLTPENVMSGSKTPVWWRCEKGHEWKAQINGRVNGEGCPYCAGRAVLAGYNDLATINPVLAMEWHPEKNGNLTPQEVMAGSNRTVWWRCEKGHEWKARIVSRATNGMGCPVCAGRTVLPGYNDLKTKYPAVAVQWHPSKNGTLTPDQVTAFNNTSVWWRCEKGHEWKAQIMARTHNAAGCPVCANKAILPGYNDLATLNPELAAQWHPTKNGNLTPHQIGLGCQKRVWWCCEKDHEWRAIVYSRAKGDAGCPFCANKIVIPGENDLTSFYPDIAAQWHPSKNGTLTPDQVHSQSNKYIWWRCEKGHEWKAAINGRTQKHTGCPYCTGRKVLAGFNDLATVDPQIAEQWHPTLNGALTPEMVTKGSHKKVWWECQLGHVWQAVVYSRTGPTRSGCPVCAGVVKRPKPWHPQEKWETTKAFNNRERIG